MFTFTYKTESKTVTVTTEEIFAPDVVQTFREFLLAVGYHPDTVAEEVPKLEDLLSELSKTSTIQVMQP
mgnify:CR=1 FL=1